MIHYDMPESDYRKLDAYGSTDLKNVLRSYHHMLSARETFDETPALKFGRAFHCAVLEPERFEKEYVVMPTFSGRGMRERKEHWILEHADQQWLDQEDMDSIREMERAIRKHDAAFNLLLDAPKREVSVTWDEGDIACKARFDALGNYQDTFAILDLKTTLDASPESFGRQVMNFGYLLQAAHYQRGLYMNLDEARMPKFFFIAVEKVEPYGIGVYRIDFHQLRKGFDLREEALRRITWEGLHPSTTPYSSAIETLELPPWALKNADQK